MCACAHVCCGGVSLSAVFRKETRITRVNSIRKFQTLKCFSLLELTIDARLLNGEISSGEPRGNLEREGRKRREERKGREKEGREERERRRKKERRKKRGEGEKRGRARE